MLGTPGGCVYAFRLLKLPGHSASSFWPSLCGTLRLRVLFALSGAVYTSRPPLSARRCTSLFAGRGSLRSLFPVTVGTVWRTLVGCGPISPPVAFSPAFLCLAFPRSLASCVVGGLCAHSLAPLRLPRFWLSPGPDHFSLTASRPLYCCLEAALPALRPSPTVGAYG